MKKNNMNDFSENRQYSAPNQSAPIPSPNYLPNDVIDNPQKQDVYNPTISDIVKTAVTEAPADFLHNTETFLDKGIKKTSSFNPLPAITDYSNLTPTETNQFQLEQRNMLNSTSNYDKWANSVDKSAEAIQKHEKEIHSLSNNLYNNYSYQYNKIVKGKKLKDWFTKKDKETLGYYKFGTQLVSTIGTDIASTLMFNPEVGAVATSAMLFPETFSTTYETLTNDGVDKKKAKDVALSASVISSLLNTVSLGKVSQVFKKDLAKKLSSKVAISEAVLLNATDEAQRQIQMKSVDKKITPQQMAKDIGFSSALGLITATGIHGTGKLLKGIHNNRIKIKKIKNKVAEVTKNKVNNLANSYNNDEIPTISDYTSTNNEIPSNTSDLLSYGGQEKTIAPETLKDNNNIIPDITEKQSNNIDKEPKQIVENTNGTQQDINSNPIPKDVNNTEIAPSILNKRKIGRTIKNNKRNKIKAKILERDNELKQKNIEKNKQKARRKADNKLSKREILQKKEKVKKQKINKLNDELIKEREELKKIKNKKYPFKNKKNKNRANKRENSNYKLLKNKNIKNKENKIKDLENRINELKNGKSIVGENKIAKSKTKNDIEIPKKNIKEKDIITKIEESNNKKIPKEKKVATSEEKVLPKQNETKIIPKETHNETKESGRSNEVEKLFNDFSSNDKGAKDIINSKRREINKSIKEKFKNDDDIKTSILFLNGLKNKLSIQKNDIKQKDFESLRKKVTQYHKKIKDKKIYENNGIKEVYNEANKVLLKKKNKTTSDYENIKNKINDKIDELSQSYEKSNTKNKEQLNTPEKADKKKVIQKESDTPTKDNEKKVVQKKSDASIKADEKIKNNDKYTSVWGNKTKTIDTENLNKVYSKSKTIYHDDKNNIMYISFKKNKKLYPYFNVTKESFNAINKAIKDGGDYNTIIKNIKNSKISNLNLMSENEKNKLLNSLGGKIANKGGFVDFNTLLDYSDRTKPDDILNNFLDTHINKNFSSKEILKDISNIQENNEKSLVIGSKLADAINDKHSKDFFNKVLSSADDIEKTIDNINTEKLDRINKDIKNENTKRVRKLFSLRVVGTTIRALSSLDTKIKAISSEMRKEVVEKLDNLYSSQIKLNGAFKEKINDLDGEVLNKFDKEFNTRKIPIGKEKITLNEALTILHGKKMLSEELKNSDFNVNIDGNVHKITDNDLKYMVKTVKDVLSKNEEIKKVVENNVNAINEISNILNETEDLEKIYKRVFYKGNAIRLAGLTIKTDKMIDAFITNNYIKPQINQIKKLIFKSEGLIGETVNSDFYNDIKQTVDVMSEFLTGNKSANVELTRGGEPLGKWLIRKAYKMLFSFSLSTPLKQLDAIPIAMIDLGLSPKTFKNFTKKIPYNLALMTRFSIKKYSSLTPKIDGKLRVLRHYAPQIFDRAFKGFAEENFLGSGKRIDKALTPFSLLSRGLDKVSDASVEGVSIVDSGIILSIFDVLEEQKLEPLRNEIKPIAKYLDFKKRLESKGKNITQADSEKLDVLFQKIADLTKTNKKLNNIYDEIGKEATEIMNNTQQSYNPLHSSSLYNNKTVKPVIALKSQQLKNADLAIDAGLQILLKGLNKNTTKRAIAVMTMLAGAGIVNAGIAKMLYNIHYYKGGNKKKNSKIIVDSIAGQVPFLDELLSTLSKGNQNEQLTSNAISIYSKELIKKFSKLNKNNVKALDFLNAVLLLKGINLSNLKDRDIKAIETIYKKINNKKKLEDIPYL